MHLDTPGYVPPRDRIDATFWRQRPISVIQPLADLRARVLERSTKRMPKWKFRLAPDLIVQIQPKVAGFFECVVCQGDGVNAASFAARPYPPVRMGFKIYTGEEWTMKVRSLHRDRGISGQHLDDVMERLATKFDCGTFDKIDRTMMLAPNCLLCGKGLTDPASMARFIGPECANTTSIEVPRTTLLDRMEAGEDAAVEEIPLVPRKQSKAPEQREVDEDAEKLGQINSIAVSIIQHLGTQLKLHNRDMAMNGLALAVAEGMQDEDELISFLDGIRELFEARQERDGYQ